MFWIKPGKSGSPSPLPAQNKKKLLSAHPLASLFPARLWSQAAKREPALLRCFPPPVFAALLQFALSLSLSYPALIRKRSLENALLEKLHKILLLPAAFLLITLPLKFPLPTARRHLPALKARLLTAALPLEQVLLLKQILLSEPLPQAYPAVLAYRVLIQSARQNLVLPALFFEEDPALSVFPALRFPLVSLSLPALPPEACQFAAAAYHSYPRQPLRPSLH